MGSLKKHKIEELLNSVEKRRISKLSRGSIRAQNGYYISNLTWKKIKDAQKERLSRISEAFYPEKYKNK